MSINNNVKEFLFPFFFFFITLFIIFYITFNISLKISYHQVFNLISFSHYTYTYIYIYLYVCIYISLVKNYSLWRAFFHLLSADLAAHVTQNFPRSKWSFYTRLHNFLLPDTLMNPISLFHCLHPLPPPVSPPFSIISTINPSSFENVK